MQIEYNTEKGTLCFFLPPTEADRFKFFNDEEPYLSYFIGAETFRKRFQKGFNLIGLTSEVREEQCKMMVDSVSGIAVEYFKDYSIHKHSSKFQFCCISGLDSFKSLMQHLKVYEINPYGEKPTETFNHPEWEYKRADWNKAQETVGKFIVLFKPND